MAEGESSGVVVGDDVGAGGGSATQTITPDGTGTISADLTWAATTASKTFSGTVAGSPATQSHTITASANGTVDFTLSWSGGVVGGQLELKLWDGATLCDSYWPLVGGSANVTCPVSGLGSYPSSRSYRLEVVNHVSSSYNYTLSGTYPATPTLDFELQDNERRPAREIPRWRVPVPGRRSLRAGHRRGRHRTRRR